MKALIFNSPQFGEIRTAGTSDQPLFCLVDVCRALDLDVNNTVRRLDKGVCSKHPLATEGGVQFANFINEDGLYDVIFDSRKPEAKAFRKWVTSEVLPSIRKTGSYGNAEYMELRAKLEETERSYLSLRSEFRQLHNVYRAVSDTLDDEGTHTEKLSFLIAKVNSLIAYNKELGGNVRKMLDAQHLTEVDFSGVKVDGDLLEVLRDIIVDYPLCASESAVADMESVNRNVRVLNSLYAVLRNHFGRANNKSGASDSLVCK
jgi:prophage antirepressor-like protein